MYKSYELEIVDSYKEFKNHFKGCLFIQEDFFQNQVHALLIKYKWVLFLVDDNIFFKKFSISQIINILLSHERAIGFSLRLGKNITRSYVTNRTTPSPAFNDVAIDQDASERTILGFEWPGAQGDFNYPLEVSSSLYRTADILRALKGLSYRNPNELETRLAQNAGLFTDQKPVLLCHERSSACCLPVNKVQDHFDNRSGTSAEYSPHSLFRRWKQASQLCIEAYSLMNPTACHEELPLAFEKKPAHSRLKSTTNPLVSIIVPTFNRGHLIETTLQSILQQTFSDFELILLDDGSTDDTEDTITKYLADSRVRYRKIEHLGNLAMVRNIGIHMAGGIYCAFCDSDDTWYKNKLEVQINYLNKHPQYKLLSAFCDVHGDIRTVWHPKLTVCSYQHLARINFIVCSMSVASTEVLRNLGGFDTSPTFPQGKDWDMWLRIARNHPFDVIRQPLGQYYSHSGGLSRKKIPALYSDLHIFFRTLERDPHLAPHLRAPIRDKGRELAWHCIKGSHWKSALSVFIKTHCPSVMRRCKQTFNIAI